MSNHSTPALHQQCVRLVRAAREGRVTVIEEDGTRRPFRLSSETPVLEEWDRVCHKDGQVWVEAWPHGAIRPTSNAKPRYLKWEINDDAAP